jgi:hypothetical protein
MYSPAEIRSRPRKIAGSEERTLAIIDPDEAGQGHKLCGTRPLRM